MTKTELLNVLNYEINEAAAGVDFIHNGLEAVFANLNGVEPKKVGEKYLEPVYDNHQSFYKKAKVVHYVCNFMGSIEYQTDIYMLESYGRNIAAVLMFLNYERARQEGEILPIATCMAVTTGTWSPTSNRHEVELFKQFSYYHFGKSKERTKDRYLDLYSNETCSHARKSLKGFKELIIIE
jgi:hypothetical protein